MNTALRRENVNGVYLPLHAKTLKDLIHCARAIPLHGLSITMPYKQAIVPFLDNTDAHTAKIGGGLLTLGVVLASYFASSAIEALRVGLNRAYGLTEKRPWWLLRLQSLGLVLVGSLALLALAFLVVLGPLILDALGAYLPWWPPPRSSDLCPPRHRGVHGRDVVLLAHLILPAHRPRLRRPPARCRADLRGQHRLRRGVRRVS